MKATAWIGLLLLVPLAGCRSDSDQACSILCISDSSVRPGDVVTVTYQPPPEHIWGVDGDLYRIEDGEQKRVAWTHAYLDDDQLETVWPDPNMVFETIGFNGDGSWEWRIPGRLEPGTYELRKDAISDEDGTIEERTLVSSVRFEVR
ncbi:MAG: hypothetical protein ACRDLB_11950 [Actinomycetota bacterium]